MSELNKSYHDRTSLTSSIFSDEFSFTKSMKRVDFPGKEKLQFIEISDVKLAG